MHINNDKFIKAIKKFLCDVHDAEILNHYEDEGIFVIVDDEYAIVRYGVIDGYDEEDRFIIKTTDFERYMEESIDTTSADLDVIKVRYDVLLYKPKNVNAGFIKYIRNAHHLIKE